AERISIDALAANFTIEKISKSGLILENFSPSVILVLLLLI
ncbi:unnamed protein product, partial [marine sediment metagenome]